MLLSELKLTLTLVVNLMLLLLTTCASNVPSDSGCLWTKMIITSDQDVLSPVTAREIDAHNKTWLKICEGRQ